MALEEWDRSRRSLPPATKLGQVSTVVSCGIGL